MPHADPKWPKWNLVLERWRAASVPEVQIIPFELGKHRPGLPWYSLEDNRQSLLYENPVVGTAYHLVEYISQADTEFKAAYKLYAFCRLWDLDGFSSYVLQPLFEKHGEKLYGWWNANARHVLPPTNARFFFDDFRFPRQAAEWTRIVEEAALTWTAIAQEWAIIRIPAWLDRSSPEFKAFEEHENSRAEERERQEYERLRKKYGDGSPV